MGATLSEYCVYRVTPPDYVHALGVDEVALSLSVTLMKSGHGGEIIFTVSDIRNRTPIVLLPQLLSPSDLTLLPSNAILYNLEQVSSESPWLTNEYVQLLRKFKLWDYSSLNQLAWSKLGIRKVKICPIGYAPELTRIKCVSEDIDVLFYGSLNDRRTSILSQIQQRGLRVVHAFGVYGEKRDELIARSKIILNIHFYEAQVLEIVRISYVLANRKCVVTEGPLAEYSFLKDGLIVASYTEIPNACVQLLSHKDTLTSIAQKGFEIIKSHSLDKILPTLLL